MGEFNLLSNAKKKYWFIRNWVTFFSDSTRFKQVLNPKKIPFIIINFNQLHYLQKLVQFAKKRGFTNIVIIDNVSTYIPLLNYYQTIENKVTIERMDKNYGHMVFFDVPEIYNKYAQHFFILTDADIEPNEKLPQFFLYKMLYLLLKYYNSVLKIGFALKIEDIPDSFPAKDKVFTWEEKFWENEVEKEVYSAIIDTTFALYKPCPKKIMMSTPSAFYSALRLGGNYTAKHGGWYIDYSNLTPEQEFYINLANSSSSWIIEKTGDTKSKEYL